LNPFPQYTVSAELLSRSWIFTRPTETDPEMSAGQVFEEAKKAVDGSIPPSSDSFNEEKMEHGARTLTELLTARVSLVEGLAHAGQTHHRGLPLRTSIKKFALSMAKSTPTKFSQGVGNSSRITTFVIGPSIHQSFQKIHRKQPCGNSASLKYRE